MRHKRGVKVSSADWDSVHRSNYETFAFWDVHWTRKARDLLASAKVLEPEVIRMWESHRAHAKDASVRPLPDHHQGTYFMLLAFGVENLLKAAIIARNSTAYRDDFRKTRKFPGELKKHDLVKLAQKAKLAFDLSEEDLLRRLTRSAIWYGRYPVPLEYKEMSGSERFSNGKEYSVSWFGGNDIERLNRFIESLPERLGHNRGGSAV